MTTSARQRIFALLDSIKADFPRRKKAAEDLMRQHGIGKALDINVGEANKVTTIPTFDPNVSRQLTPMLKARFEYAGSWRMGQEIWLSASQMASAMRKKKIQRYHLALRENWEDSAPMTYSDDRLSLFEVTEGVPEDLTYLVWKTDSGEPEVWVYEGFDSHRFKNLEDFFKWRLERE